MTITTRIQALCFFALAALLSHASQAFNTVSVQVTVNSSSTFSGDWDEWWGKPDQFVVFYGDGTSRQFPACQSNPVINLMFVGPPAPADWSCNFTVNRPARLYIGLYDGDGPNSDNTQGQQIDIAPGTATTAMFNLETLLSAPGVPFTFTSAGDQGTISYTVSAAIKPASLGVFYSDKTSFRPSVGEQILLTATAGGAPYTFLRVRAYNSAGAEVWNIFGYLDNPGQMSKQFVWQGRDPNGNPLPPGTYTLKFQASDISSPTQAIGPLNGIAGGVTGPGGFLKATVVIAAPPPVPTLGVVSVYPGQQWAPEVGDLTIRVASNAAAQVSGEVFAGSNCGGGKILDLPSIYLAAAQPAPLTWSMPTTGSGMFMLGPYSIKVSGTSGGAPTAPASLCQAITMTSAPPATLYVQHAPFLATPGQTVELTARSVDPTGAPRIVGRLDVFGSVQTVPGVAPAPPTSPLKTCTMVSSCTATLNLPAGGSFFSWRATAADRAGTMIAAFGWRGQRVMSSTSFAQATTWALPTDVALNGPAMGDARDGAHSFDLLFSVSTDFNWNNTADRQSISDSLDRFMTRLWGIDGNGAPAPTTFLARPDLVRVYLTSEQHVVSWNPVADLCDWTVPVTPWADATAVLHKTNCRDNAYTSTRSFSAQLFDRDTIFHELHHALFGLSDEYPSGTGGYFEGQPFANVFNLQTDCEAVVGREAGGCQPIIEKDRVTLMPTGVTFFRLDKSLTDVTVDNGTQRFGDIRRANFMEGVCDAGGC